MILKQPKSTSKHANETFSQSAPLGDLENCQFKLYLGLGSNEGDRQSHLRFGLEKIEKKIGLITKQSSVYETAPWGFESKQAFLNMAIEVATTIKVENLLQLVKEIEQQSGRNITTRTDGQYQDRTLDIDILLYGDLILHTDKIQIPHAHMHKRMFVLKPLAEIASELTHPLLRKTITKLMLETSDTSKIKLLEK